MFENLRRIAFFGAGHQLLAQFIINQQKVIGARNMADCQFQQVGDVLRWNKMFLRIGGIWPLESTYIRSWIWIIYLTIHLSMQYAELYANLGILDLMVNNIVETVFQTMVLAKFIVIRHSKTLRRLIVAIQEDFDETNFDDLEEKKIYMKYNLLAKLFVKITIPMMFAGAVLYYLVPLEHFLRTRQEKKVDLDDCEVRHESKTSAALIFLLFFLALAQKSHLSALVRGKQNDTSPYVLPFRTRLFFSLSDTRTYVMVYAYQSPMIYVLVSHSAWFCLLTMMVLHICGQLAVLQHRIKNIKISTDNDNDDSNAIFGRLAEKHMKSIWMARTMDDAFNLVLLQDLVGSTLLLGLTSYLALVRTQTEFMVFCIAVVATIAFLLLLYAYCIVGECLIDESTKVHETYYQCRWYESSQNFRKCLLISIGTTREPLYLSAGKAYIFCLNGFTDILRTAMGYLSLLRNFA